VVNLEKKVLGTSGEIVSNVENPSPSHFFSIQSSRVHSALDLNIFFLDEKLRFENISSTPEPQLIPKNVKKKSVDTSLPRPTTFLGCGEKLFFVFSSHMESRCLRNQACCSSLFILISRSRAIED
jgi:hypothetical protein